MPYTVETASNGCDRGEDGIGHPYGKDGVLLSHGLPSSDAVVLRISYMAPDGELCPAADEGYQGYPNEHGKGDAAMHNRTCGDGDGHCQGNGPQVEGGVTGVLQASSKTGHGVAYEPGKQ